MQLFDDAGDYLAFVRVLVAGIERYPQARLISYCLMPNHWHLVFWPRRGSRQKKGQSLFYIAVRSR
jgi:putative transposase